MRSSASSCMRLRVFRGLLFGLRRHDFRAAATWINTMYPSGSSGPPGKNILSCESAVKIERFG